MKNKPNDEVTLLSGFQDFLPGRMLQRNQVIATVRGCFERFGFLPQDTPCLERAELLFGKYGVESEKLIYSFTDHGGRHIALRYDLTVPLGRIIGTYAHQIKFPYRRYQMGMVWRADSPGKGRFREFMQMDCDIVDDGSVVADIEILLLAIQLMRSLGIAATIRFNCRPILDALIEVCGLDAAAGVTLLRIIDKFDKIGMEGVLHEMNTVGFSSGVIDCSRQYLSINGSNEAVLQQLSSLLSGAESFHEGSERLATIISAFPENNDETIQCLLDPTIARGLDYYTGVIFETTLRDDSSFGSVCSGGRYDQLFVRSDGRTLPSIGLSIGIDRLLAALQSLGQLPVIGTTTQVYIVNFDNAYLRDYVQVAQTLRDAGIAVEVSSRSGKIAKQFKVANDKGIPLVILMGPDEIAQAIAVIKDMRVGTQTNTSIAEMVPAVQKALT